MTIDDKIKEKKLQYDILTEKQQKNQRCHLDKSINMNFLQAQKYYLLINVEQYEQVYIFSTW